MGKPKTGLMLVEDPEDTIKAMCKFENCEFDWEKYKKAYEQIKNRQNPIHKKHACARALLRKAIPRSQTY